ncbi:MAG: hypothetical protein EOP46_01460 [Sphingobacteriaceae bacterium]|nr:MAG: hypothetical protein EOP46_01460 [Sphingobacteriaceae bacterium]
MSLQYISDEAGNHTAVIIPIEDWNEITTRYEDLKSFTEKTPTQKRARKPSDFIGSISKAMAKEMIADIEKSRSEWEKRV